VFLLFPILRRLLVAAALLAALAVGGELLARKLIADAVSHAVSSRIAASAQVSFGSTPLLMQIASGRLDAVAVSAQAAHIDGIGPLSLRGTLRDVRLRSLTSLEGGIGSLEVRASLKAAAVRPLLETPACVGSLPAPLRAALTASPRVALFPGRVDLLPPRGRAVEVRLHPYAAGHELRFAITAIEPALEPLAAVRAQAACVRALRDLPFGVALVSAGASRGALNLAFSGVGASFAALG
jgi:hypothetical protein